MPRVNLEILRGPYRPALGRGIRIETCRILTDVSLRAQRGWTTFRPAVVDTGAPVSLFPHRAWQGVHARTLGRFSVGGLSRKPECMFGVTLAIVVLTIRDALHQISPIETHALLADTDDVPTLLGMRGVLANMKLHLDAAAGEAFLEAD